MADHVRSRIEQDVESWHVDRLVALLMESIDARGTLVLKCLLECFTGILECTRKVKSRKLLDRKITVKSYLAPRSVPNAEIEVPAESQFWRQAENGCTLRYKLRCQILFSQRIRVSGVFRLKLFPKSPLTILLLGLEIDDANGTSAKLTDDSTRFNLFQKSIVSQSLTKIPVAAWSTSHLRKSRTNNAINRWDDSVTWD